MKILVVRVGRTGDMVMCTPALSALLEHYPDAEFTILTSTDGKRVLGDFDERIVDFWIYNRKHLLSFLIKRSLSKKITKGRFDLIYCFESKPSYYSLFKGSAAPLYGLADVSRNTHYAQLLLDVVSKGVGSDVGFYPLHLPVSDTAVREINEYLETFGIKEETFVLAMHPTFRGVDSWIKGRKRRKDKLWPLSSYAELACLLQRYALQKDFDLKVVMNLLPDEVRIGATIENASQGCVVILSPEPNFKRYQAFLKRVDLLVVPDTGPMHIAAALGTPLVALFSGKDPDDCGPFGRSKQLTVLRAEDSKMPGLGITAISVERVYQACIEQIELSR